MSKFEYGSSPIKTRSQELKKDKSCKHSSGCSFDPNIMEINQEGLFDIIEVIFEYELSLVKN
jgi:hypothetical protein